jgi:hypothetical protein
MRRITLGTPERIIPQKHSAGTSRSCNRIVWCLTGLAWAERQGITAVSARCYAAEGGLAYAPLATCCVPESWPS